jgi:hypothetical protein
LSAVHIAGAVIEQVADGDAIRRNRAD